MSDLKWDAERHDKAVNSLREREGRKKAAALISQVYTSWKRRFKKKPKTQPEVIQELYRLRDMVADACKHTPGMEEWRTFTMNLIDDQISKVVNTECGKLNVFTERAVDTSENAVSIPEYHTFSSSEELEAIPFLKKHVEREGFVGFIRDGRMIYALYGDG